MCLSRAYPFGSFASSGLLCPFPRLSFPLYPELLLSNRLGSNLLVWVLRIVGWAGQLHLWVLLVCPLNFVGRQLAFCPDVLASHAAPLAEDPIPLLYRAQFHRCLCFSWFFRCIHIDWPFRPGSRCPECSCHLLLHQMMEAQLGCLRWRRCCCCHHAFRFFCHGYC